MMVLTKILIEVSLDSILPSSLSDRVCYEMYPLCVHDATALFGLITPSSEMCPSSDVLQVTNMTPLPCKNIIAVLFRKLKVLAQRSQRNIRTKVTMVTNK